MEVVIDLDAPVPVFAQLIQQIKRAVQAGDLRPGDPLPSIRQLASDLDLNKKTVAKAFGRLERDSVIETKGYRGSFVHPNAKANSRIDMNGVVKKELTRTVRALREAGAADSEIRIAFGEVMTPSDR